ncbi:hypothetical protein [Blastococcus xanthinilyticus]|uniref:Uncharacterized protein n=1 Tax=Blastococcus xanthinilyticus TaxID=1564164 RepID=A0A5S5CPD7_9ACTN|nr:hypothetical protein [Blastococcus xanthinilyticus]TYP84911.1 hypothetical protein BD833_11226 [Blastococcus xanthinilyticus]
MSSPWSDPGTPADQGPAYAGPPPTAPPPYGYAAPGPYGQPPYGQGYYGPPPGYGPPPYGYPGGYPAAPYPGGPPRRPGQVVGAAVLGFVQALLVLIASLYVWFFASIAELAIAESPTAAPAQAYEFAREGTVLAVVQLLSVVLLVAAGILALTRRARYAWGLLVGALVAQLGLAAYWWAQLNDLLGPAAGAQDVTGVLAALSLFFSAAPLVALGLVLLGGGRRWFTAPQG